MMSVALSRKWKTTTKLIQDIQQEGKGQFCIIDMCNCVNQINDEIRMWCACKNMQWTLTKSIYISLCIIYGNMYNVGNGVYQVSLSKSTGIRAWNRDTSLKVKRQPTSFFSS